MEQDVETEFLDLQYKLIMDATQNGKLQRADDLKRKLLRYMHLNSAAR